MVQPYRFFITTNSLIRDVEILKILPHTWTSKSAKTTSWSERLTPPRQSKSNKHIDTCIFSAQYRNRDNFGIVLRKVGIPTLSAGTGIVPDNSRIAQGIYILL